MNYISELNAFDNWIDTHPMSANAIGLWRALMQIANRARWRESLAIPNALITLKSGLTTTSIKRAREELRQAGRITFDFRTGRQATIYHIIPFADQKAVQNGPQSNEGETVAVQNGPQNEPQKNKADQKAVQNGPQDDVAVQVAVRVADQIGPQNGPIYKHKQNKEINKTTTVVVPPPPVDGVKETSELFEKNVHPFSGLVERDMLCDLVEAYGSTWVQSAIREAIRQGVLRMSYIAGILKSWKARGGPSSRRKPEKGKALTAAEKEDLLREGFEL